MKGHVLAVVEDPDEQCPALPLGPLAFAGARLGLFGLRWGTPPQLEHHPRREPRKGSFLQPEGAQQRGDGDVVSRGQAEDFLSPGAVPGRALHPGGGLVEEGVHR